MSELADVALVAWAFDFDRDQKAFLVRAAGLGSALVNRAWHELAGSERILICAALSRAVAVAETVSGDLSGGA